MSTHDEKRDIAARNKALEKAGKTSRYIDSAPEEDYTFEGDVHAVDAMAKVDMPPERFQALALRHEVDVRQQLEDRGLSTRVAHPSAKKESRLQTIEKFMAQDLVMYGHVRERYLDEYLKLNGTPHPEDKR